MCVLPPGCRLLLQDCRGARRGRHPGGLARRGDHVSRTRNDENGEEQRDRALSAVGGDAVRSHF